MNILIGKIVLNLHTRTERLLIKGFKNKCNADKFLNKNDNTFFLYKGPITKPGTYAYASGAWHNVKSLDTSVLAHV